MAPQSLAKAVSEALEFVPSALQTLYRRNAHTYRSYDYCGTFPTFPCLDRAP